MFTKILFYKKFSKKQIFLQSMLCDFLSKQEKYKSYNQFFDANKPNNLLSQNILFTRIKRESKTAGSFSSLVNLTRNSNTNEILIGSKDKQEVLVFNKHLRAKTSNHNFKTLISHFNFLDINIRLNISPKQSKINLKQQKGDFLTTLEHELILFQSFWKFFQVHTSFKNFFPQRKSFLCYWLFPFVGFVSLSFAYRETININLKRDFIPSANAIGYSDFFSPRKPELGASELEIKIPVNYISLETLEYLNYKKLLLDQSTSNSKKNLGNLSNFQHSFNNFWHKQQKEHFVTYYQNRQIESKFLQKLQQEEQEFKSLCQFMVKQSLYFIYLPEIGGNPYKANQFEYTQSINKIRNKMSNIFDVRQSSLIKKSKTFLNEKVSDNMYFLNQIIPVTQTQFDNLLDNQSDYFNYISQSLIIKNILSRSYFDWNWYSWIPWTEVFPSRIRAQSGAPSFLGVNTNIPSASAPAMSVPLTESFAFGKGNRPSTKVDISERGRREPTFGFFKKTQKTKSYNNDQNFVSQNLNVFYPTWINNFLNKQKNETKIDKDHNKKETLDVVFQQTEKQLSAVANDSRQEFFPKFISSGEDFSDVSISALCPQNVDFRRRSARAENADSLLIDDLLMKNKNKYVSSFAENIESIWLELDEFPKKCLPSTSDFYKIYNSVQKKSFVWLLKQESIVKDFNFFNKTIESFPQGKKDRISFSGQNKKIPMEFLKKSISTPVFEDQQFVDCRRRSVFLSNKKTDEDNQYKIVTKSYLIGIRKLAHCNKISNLNTLSTFVDGGCFATNKSLFCNSEKSWLAEESQHMLLSSNTVEHKKISDASFGFGKALRAVSGRVSKKEAIPEITKPVNNSLINVDFRRLGVTPKDKNKLISPSRNSLDFQEHLTYLLDYKICKNTLESSFLDFYFSSKNTPEQSHKIASIFLENEIKNLFFEKGIILFPNHLEKLNFWKNVGSRRIISGRGNKNFNNFYHQSKILSKLQKFLQIKYNKNSKENFSPSSPSRDIKGTSRWLLSDKYLFNLNVDNETKQELRFKKLRLKINDQVNSNNANYGYSLTQPQKIRYALQYVKTLLTARHGWRDPTLNPPSLTNLDIFQFKYPILMSGFEYPELNTNEVFFKNKTLGSAAVDNLSGRGNNYLDYQNSLINFIHSKNIKYIENPYKKISPLSDMRLLYKSGQSIGVGRKPCRLLPASNSPSRIRAQRGAPFRIKNTSTPLATNLIKTKNITSGKSVTNIIENIPRKNIFRQINKHWKYSSLSTFVDGRFFCFSGMGKPTFSVKKTKLNIQSRLHTTSPNVIQVLNEKWRPFSLISLIYSPENGKFFAIKKSVVPLNHKPITSLNYLRKEKKTKQIVLYSTQNAKALRAVSGRGRKAQISQIKPFFSEKEPNVSSVGYWPSRTSLIFDNPLNQNSQTFASLGKGNLKNMNAIASTEKYGYSQTKQNKFKRNLIKNNLKKSMSTSPLLEIIRREPTLSNVKKRSTVYTFIDYIWVKVKQNFEKIFYYWFYTSSVFLQKFVQNLSFIKLNFYKMLEQKHRKILNITKNDTLKKNDQVILIPNNNNNDQRGTPNYIPYSIKKMENLKTNQKNQKILETPEYAMVKKYFIKSLEKRRVEKIFRTYLSCKNKLNLPVALDKISSSKLSTYRKSYKQDFFDILIRMRNFMNHSWVDGAVGWRRPLTKVDIVPKNKYPDFCMQPSREGAPKVFKKYCIRTLGLRASLLHSTNVLTPVQSFFRQKKTNELVTVLAQGANSVERLSLFREGVKQKKINIKNQKKVSKSIRITPNLLLKRIHFLFITLKNKKTKSILELKKDQEQCRFFWKTKKPTVDDSRHLFLQKRKNVQKKRRRKKQKRETRRRKKRKRFYPRPTWLRFRFYKNLLKKRNTKYPFLAVRYNQLSFPQLLSNYNMQSEKLKDKNLSTARHGRFPFPKASLNTDENRQNLKSSFEKIQLNRFRGNSKRFEKTKILKIKMQKNLIRNKIYRNNKQNWGYCLNDTEKFINLRSSNMLIPNSIPIFANRHLFQISNAVMGDFKRLFWKSNWLRSKLNPYINRIHNYFEKIQDFNHQWHFLNSLKNYLLNFLGFNYNLKNSYFLNNVTNGSLSINRQNFLISKKISIPLWYVNIKNSFDKTAWSPLQVNNSQYYRTIQFFEYNRILYQRLQDIIKNIKRNLNVDGQNKSRASSPGRRKRDKILYKNLWIRLGRLISLESPEPSIKSLGQLTKLRIYWALNKTNIFSFKEVNKTKTLWTSLKKRDQNKSNNTKKLINKIWSVDFSFLPSANALAASAPRQISPTSTTVSKLEDFNSEQQSMYTNVSKKIEHKYVKNSLKLNSMYFSKVNNKQQKITFLGLKEKNYKNYLLNLKKQYKTLLSFYNVENQKGSTVFSNKKDILNRINYRNLSTFVDRRFPFPKASLSGRGTDVAGMQQHGRLLTLEENTKLQWAKTIEGVHKFDNQNSIALTNEKFTSANALVTSVPIIIPKLNNAKRSFNFWWSINSNHTNYFLFPAFTENIKFNSLAMEDLSFLLNKQAMLMSTFVDGRHEPTNTKFHEIHSKNNINQTFVSIGKGNLKNMNILSIEQNANVFAPVTFLSYIDKFLPSVTFWIVTVLFHICILFSFIRISEIRTLLKFYLLIIYKILNSYIIFIYFIFNSLKNYKNLSNKFSTMSFIYIKNFNNIPFYSKLKKKSWFFGNQKSVYKCREATTVDESRHKNSNINVNVLPLPENQKGTSLSALADKEKPSRIRAQRVAPLSASADRRRQSTFRTINKKISKVDILIDSIFEFNKSEFKGKSNKKFIILTKQSRSSLLGIIYRIPLFIKNSNGSTKILGYNTDVFNADLSESKSISLPLSFEPISKLNNVFSFAKNIEKIAFDKNSVLHANTLEKKHGDYRNIGVLVSKIDIPVQKSQIDVDGTSRSVFPFPRNKKTDEDYDNQIFEQILFQKHRKNYSMLAQNYNRFLVLKKFTIFSSFKFKYFSFFLIKKFFQSSVKFFLKLPLMLNKELYKLKIILIKENFLIIPFWIQSENFLIVGSRRPSTKVDKATTSENYNNVFSRAEDRRKLAFDNSLPRANAQSIKMPKIATKNVDFREGFTPTREARADKNKLLLVKNKSFIIFLTLIGIKVLFQFFNKIFILLYTFVVKCLDIIENVMFVIYKFLEKPAELMIEWIAQVFLVEWTADVLTYIPETMDIYFWNSFYKFSRNFKTLGIAGTLIQRRLWCMIEIFIELITKPDADLLLRQKRGIIFWDIWAEILTQAADNYNINIPSLSSLKEEQELLIENLLKDSNWYWSKPILVEMTPLLNLIQIQKPSIRKKISSSGFLFDKNKNVEHLRCSTGHKNGLLTLLEPTGGCQINSRFSWFLKNFENKIIIKNDNEEKWRRWSANQYFTYQGKDTDLFIDIHPPKTFQHMSVIKYYEPIQQPLGNLVCQIFSGLFNKQVAKNLLIVGAPGSGKTMFIQALAGETELKIITDNANRYALVLRGVAVGMKLLKDVFDALALHTPCLFLMEDIHIIGERRPLLISDDENAKATESSMGFEREEVHEKNQVIYQLSRHSICHYQKPYKGDFSLLIPTNHFCFDLFLGVSPPRARRFQTTPSHPLPLDYISLELTKQNDTGSHTKNKPFSEILETSLQLPTDKFFAPPSTSPFTILVIKQQKKLKPKKLVKQLPWGGLSWDQMMLIPKITYSIKIKVALLAEIAISNLTVKLDIITDLLIIIDSVRSNRGFVVFATTHIPYILDPALRRPGRLDETISLPLVPNLLNRWEILKSYTGIYNNVSSGFSNGSKPMFSQTIQNIRHKDRIPMLIHNSRELKGELSDSNTLDILDYAIFSKNLTETELVHLVSRAKLLLCAPLNIFSSIYTQKEEIYNKFLCSEFSKNFFCVSEETRLFSQKRLSNFDDAGHLLQTFASNPLGKGHQKYLGKGENMTTSSLLPGSCQQAITFLSKIYKYPDVSNQEFLAKKRFVEIPTLLKKIGMNSNVVETSLKIQLKKLKHLSNFSVSKKQNNLTVNHPPASEQGGLINSNQDLPLNRDKLNSKSLIKLEKNIFSVKPIFSDMSSLKKLKYYPFSFSGPSNTLAIAYYHVGKFLIHSQVVKDQTSYSFIMWTKSAEIFNKMDLEDLSFTTLYSSNSEVVRQCLKLFAGKIGEFFIFANASPGVSTSSLDRNNLIKDNGMDNDQTFASPPVGSRRPSTKVDIVDQLKISSNFILNQTILPLETTRDSSKNTPRSFNGLWSLNGIDNLWRSATSLIYSLIQKRYLYNKNLLISRLFHIQNRTVLKDPPSPSSTNILVPAKRFENYKRNEKDFNKKPFSSINEKIQIHQQQRLIKSLYNQPLTKYFRSETINKRYTEFNTSFRELIYLDSFTRKISSINSFYRNKILIRHKFYLTNQWWNGQLAEHNIETTYLSDVDWRYNFLESVGDVMVDFPDTDQYYNPRMRRWIITSGYWGDWYNLEKTMNYEIYYHFVQEYFNKTFIFLSNHREILDYLAFIFMKNGILKEIDLINSLKRFYMLEINGN